jgi:hypothetical protein
MKKTLFILVLVATMFNCSSDDTTTPLEDNSIEATLIGRWNLVGFESNVLYEFTENKRFAIYSTDGVFGTVEDQIADGLMGLDWFYEGDTVVVDLNFGNMSILTPQYVCDNYVINWIAEDGSTHSTIYREGFDYSSCDE